MRRILPTLLITLFASEQVPAAWNLDCYRSIALRNVTEAASSFFMRKIQKWDDVRLSTDPATSDAVLTGSPLQLRDTTTGKVVWQSQHRVLDRKSAATAWKMLRADYKRARKGGGKCLTGLLYPLGGGEESPVRFTYNKTGRGDIWINLSGDSCHGHYVTVGGADVTWGNIFASAQSGSAVASGRANSLWLGIPSTQRGAGVVSCPATTLNCEYITSSWRVQGHGACRDSDGAMYKLVF